MKKEKSILFYIILWGFFILALLLFPMKEYPTHVQTYYDKVVHFVLFGVFAYLISKYLIVEKGKNFYRAVSYAFLFSSFYAFFLEFLQNYVPGRTVDNFDLLAGTSGALFAGVFAYLFLNKAKPSLLLHICCIGCGVYVSQVLQKEYNISLYFYNPNIFPLREYEKRLEEIKKVAKRYKIKVILGEYDHKKWREMVRGHEADPERGERCMICYRERLEESARYAHENGFDYFTTTLTTSPHKDAQAIMQFGKELAREYDIGFLERDFKKQDGFKKSSAMSRELGLYRQDYCGCEFSLAEAEKRRARRT